MPQKPDTSLIVNDLLHNHQDFTETLQHESFKLKQPPALDTNFLIRIRTLLDALRRFEKNRAFHQTLITIFHQTHTLFDDPKQSAESSLFKKHKQLYLIFCSN